MCSYLLVVYHKPITSVTEAVVVVIVVVVVVVVVVLVVETNKLLLISQVTQHVQLSLNYH